MHECERAFGMGSDCVVVKQFYWKNGIKIDEINSVNGVYLCNYIRLVVHSEDSANPYL